MKNNAWLFLLPFFAASSQAQIKIGAVQGRADKSPMVGKTVEVQGIVTGDFQGADQLGGFFMQDSGDGDEATSDGIFVYAPLGRNNAVDVQSGTFVRVSGIAEEYSGQTQIGRPQVQAMAGAKVKKPEPLPLKWPLPDGIFARTLRRNAYFHHAAFNCYQQL